MKMDGKIKIRLKARKAYEAALEVPRIDKEAMIITKEQYNLLQIRALRQYWCDIQEEESHD